MVLPSYVNFCNSCN